MPNECPIELPNGETYPSIGACARALGLSRHAVAKALERGSLASLGTKSRKITIDGTTYLSFAKAEIALGLATSYISTMVQRHNSLGEWTSPSGMKFQWDPEGFKERKKG